MHKGGETAAAQQMKGTSLQCLGPPKVCNWRCCPGGGKTEQLIERQIGVERVRPKIRGGYWSDEKDTNGGQGGETILRGKGSRQDTALRH